jgi:hypothetical protein
MTSFADSHIDNYAECAVCRTDTLLLCSPCGDPVCPNCRCPNGCEEAAAGTPVYFGVQTRYVDAAA